MTSNAMKKCGLMDRASLSFRMAIYLLRPNMFVNTYDILYKSERVCSGGFPGLKDANVVILMNVKDSGTGLGSTLLDEALVDLRAPMSCLEEAPQC